MRQGIVQAADRSIAIMMGQGYAVPFRPWGDVYSWGSNGNILYNIILIAAAFELTGDARYSDASFEAMDYLLGRNALSQSYVTGYGTRYSENQFHSFWAHQWDPAFPHPPAGTLAGGPNSFPSEFDTVAYALLGCRAPKCYVDDATAFSMNEPSIGLNAALVWVASALVNDPHGYHHTAKPPKAFYLALGDSIPYGFDLERLIEQFETTGLVDPTAFVGYAELLAQNLRTLTPDLVTVNLSCPGENTQTMLEGGCPWSTLGACRSRWTTRGHSSTPRLRSFKITEAR